MNITICGSLRYEQEIQYWHEWLAFNGHTVYSMVVLPSQKAIDGVPQKDWYSASEKQTLDLLHLSKIEESNAIFVVDIDGYIGESTAREIEWAIIRRKYVYYLSRKDHEILAHSFYQTQQRYVDQQRHVDMLWAKIAQAAEAEGYIGDEQTASMMQQRLSDDTATK